MRLATATLSLAALFALVTPALADPANASNYWERQRSQPAQERRPYALTGDSHRSSDGGFTAHTCWIGGGRDRRTTYKRS
jgi:hypothetical protein